MGISAAPWVLMMLVAESLLAGCSGQAKRPGADLRRSIVLISIDTLRADHLGCYGYQRPTSPFIDSLAGDGVLMEQAISSAPWTLPSHASLLTGVSPATHRAVEGTQGIAPQVRLAAERFRAAGIQTAAVVSSWFVSRHYGFDRGFDHFVDFDQTQRSNTTHKIHARQVVDEAARWLRTHGQRPFFLWLHFYDVHFDYDPPPEDRKLFETAYQGERPRYRKYSYYQDHPLSPELLAHEVALYDGEIHRVDGALRRFVRLLHDTLPAGRQPLLVVTADHGEEFFERGSWGHAHTLYDEQVHVPLIFSGSGLPAGRRLPAQVRQIDLLPTLMQAAGLPAPVEVEGRSFWSALQGKAALGERPRPAFMETSRFSTDLVGLRQQGWKLIRDLVSGQEHLFHVAQDPGERNDQRSTAGQRLLAMQRDLDLMLDVVLPDRWLIRWDAAGEEDLVGELATSGAFLETRFRGAAGEAQPAGSQELKFRLPPGGTLEMAVWPVDAVLELAAAPRAGGQPVRVLLGRASRPATFPGLTLSAAQSEVLEGLPTPVPPAAALWLEQSRGGGMPVPLSPEDRRRLESLGYAFAGSAEQP